MASPYGTYVNETFQVAVADSSIWNSPNTHICGQCDVALDDENPRWYRSETAGIVYCDACALPNVMTRVEADEWDRRHKCWCCSLAKQAREGRGICFDPLHLTYEYDYEEWKKIWDELTAMDHSTAASDAA